MFYNNIKAKKDAQYNFCYISIGRSLQMLSNNLQVTFKNLDLDFNVDNDKSFKTTYFTVGVDNTGENVVINGTRIYAHSTCLGRPLAKNNTTAFTPTGDYNPATKKYVDDSVASVNPIATVTIIPSQVIDPENMIFQLTQDQVDVFTNSKFVNIDVSQLGMDNIFTVFSIDDGTEIIYTNPSQAGVNYIRVRYTNLQAQFVIKEYASEEYVDNAIGNAIEGEY